MKTVAQVLAISDEAGVCDLQLADFSERDITPEEFTHILRLLKAFWLHNGDSRMPHAELTSGLCSNGFVNCGIPLSYANLCRILAEQLARVVRQDWDGPVDWVVGSDHAAAALVAYVADIFNARFDFCEKGPDAAQLWRRHQIPEGAQVLHVEELMTTALTAEAVRLGIRQEHTHPVNFIPVLPVLVHRSDVKQVDGSRVVYPFHFDIWTAEPTQCQLCAQGSPRVRPKGDWHYLTTGKR